MATTEQIGVSGIADETHTMDYETSVKDIAHDPANDVREVKIRVPAHIPDNVVFNAWQVGMGTIQRMSMGLMVVAFPSVGKGANGEPVNTIGKAEMIISKVEDIHRVLELIKVINDVNMKIAEAANQPSNLLGATLEGRKIKDEALRQAKQAADGQVPIVLATEAPRRTRG